MTGGTGPGHGQPRPIVIAGMPRSGTTWTMEVLGCDPSLLSFMEPDSEGHRASAIWAKRRAGRFPQLAPGDRNDDYRRLWSWVFGGAAEGLRLRMAAQVLRVSRPREVKSYLRGEGSVKMTLAATLGRRPPNRERIPEQRLLVKTVHAPLSIEWLAAEFDFDAVIVLRHPGSVLASWLDLDFVDQYVDFEVRPALRNLVTSWGVPLPGTDQLERTIWRIGVLTTALEKAVAANPAWVVRTHEQLCVDPTSEFRRLYDDLGLTWNARAEAHLAASDRAGKGFRTQRVAAELAGNWKRRLTLHQITEMQRVLAWFPLTTWSADDLGVHADD